MIEVFICDVCNCVLRGPTAAKNLQCGRNTGKFSIRDGDVIPIKCGGNLRIASPKEVEAYVGTRE